MIKKTLGRVDKIDFPKLNLFQMSLFIYIFAYLSLSSIIEKSFF